MSSSAADLAGAAADVQTNRQARAILGIVASYLREAYQATDQISTGQGLRAQAVSYLDTVNRYATEVYAGIPDDGGAISFANAARLGLVTSQANDALANIEEAVGVSRWDLAASMKKAVSEIAADVSTVAEGIGETAGNVAAAPFQGVVAGLAAFAHSARTFLIIAGLLGGAYLFRRQIAAGLAKAAS